jgi:hypothetical protein
MDLYVRVLEDLRRTRRGSPLRARLDGIADTLAVRLGRVR